MIILEDLPLEERKLYLEQMRLKSERDKQTRCNVHGNSGVYEIRQEARLMILDKPVTHTGTCTEWKVLFMDNKNIQAGIEVLSEKENMKSQWYELFGLMKKLTKPLDRIVFDLEEYGRIKAIANQNEIISKWNEVKQEFTADPNFAELIKFGDTDYSGPLHSIWKNIIYQLFFFSTNKFSRKMNEPVVLGDDVLLQSVIFPECNFKAKVQDKLVGKSKGLLRFEQNTAGGTPDLRQIKRLYKQKYNPFIKQNTGSGSDVDYSISYNSDYGVYEDTGKLLHCKTVFEEWVNENLYYKSEIEIKLKEQ